MGSERNSKWYDEVWSTLRRKVPILPNKFSHWPLWAQGVEWVVKQGNDVVDLGCGPGYVARMIAETPSFTGSYQGFDFSEVAISIARGTVRDPRFRFEVADLAKTEDWLPKSGGPHTYLLCEVLEHINKDLEILEAVPSGSKVWISVPTFDVKAHVRHFPSCPEAMGRYFPYLSDATSRGVQGRAPAKGNLWWAISGTRG